jgi:CheY-like chemotaxis protein
VETQSLMLLLADDDKDDCYLFKEALEELPFPIELKTVNDGVELMNMLTLHESKLPDLLFLDLNMPRKTGFECLLEIKHNERLKTLPVIIYSTSLNHEVVNSLYEKGAQYYIRKPGEFSKLKKSIQEAVTLTSSGKKQKITKENFIIQVK